MNSLFVIAHYKYEGMWAFDDLAVGLSKEPFIAGIDTMIDKIVAGSPNADKGFRAIFSAAQFPGADFKLDGAAKNRTAIGITATNSKWKGGSAPHC